jgi:CRP-like cAMP-binding protein
VSDGHEHLASAEMVEQLRATPLFGGLGEQQLVRLVEMGEIVDLPAGARLIGEGDVADALFVVLAGELEVTRRAGNSDVPVARVGPGSLQGEIAALEGGRRLASVHAATEAEVLRIPIGAVRELLSAGPDVSLAIIRTAVSRLREMEATLRERGRRGCARRPPPCRGDRGGGAAGASRVIAEPTRRRRPAALAARTSRPDR